MERFDDIRHNPLKAFNRYIMASNIFESSGRASLEDYLNQFSKKEVIDIKTIHQLIEKQGIKATREAVTKGLEFKDG